MTIKLKCIPSRKKITARLTLKHFAERLLCLAKYDVQFFLPPYVNKCALRTEELTDLLDRKEFE